jgi:hypothetical protein
LKHTDNCENSEYWFKDDCTILDYDWQGQTIETDKIEDKETVSIPENVRFLGSNIYTCTSKDDCKLQLKRVGYDKILEHEQYDLHSGQFIHNINYISADQTI